MAKSAQAAPKLYSPRLLALSASLADYPLLQCPAHQAQDRSRTCGSTISIGLDLDPEGKVSRLGMQVSACAVGQSSAAILAQEIVGRSKEDVAAEFESIRGWLRGDTDLPQWPGFDALEPALPHSGRHEALLMPWRAAMKALSTPAINS